MDLMAYNDKRDKIELIDTGKSGGEGKIFRIRGNNSECAKIFHPEKITDELHKKTLAMVDSPPHDVMWDLKKHRSFAWPNTVLYNMQHRQFIGFTMPRIDLGKFREAHNYYDPDDRLKRFKGAITWSHLFMMACNITSTIASLHEKGHCIGDMRETNILVSYDSLVTFIDCDSFQIQDKRSGKIFYNRVCTPEYLPPELMETDFKNENCDRYYSDLFALGIIIFKFLLNGTHPYQAKGALVKDLASTEAKIKKGYFAYGGLFSGVEPPDHALPYNIIPPPIQDLFFKCFVDGHKEPKKRPTAKEWFKVLRDEL